METVEHDANVENNEVTQEVQEKVNWGRFAFDIIETLLLAVDFVRGDQCNLCAGAGGRFQYATNARRRRVCVGE